MLATSDDWDGILFSSPEEVQEGHIPATEETVEIAVERAIQASRGLDSAVQLVFGIDPAEAGNCMASRWNSSRQCTIGAN